MEFTILSFNAYGLPISMSRARRKALLLELERLSPDVICLQEVIFKKDALRLSRELESRGYRVDAKYGKYLTRGGLVTASRIPFESKHYQLFEQQGRFFSSQFYDRVLGKGYQRVRIKVGTKIVTIINTHLVAPYSKVLTGTGTADQVDELIGIIEEAQRPLIVCGDLNFPPEDRLYETLVDSTCNYRDFLGKTCLFDPLRESGLYTVIQSNTLQKGLYKAKKDERLDYTLLSSDLKGKQEIIFTTPHALNGSFFNLSDHFGLFTKVTV